MNYDAMTRDELRQQVVILQQKVTNLTHQLRNQTKASESTFSRETTYWRLTVENVQDLMSLHTPEGAFLHVTPSTFDILGYEPSELIGVDPYTLFHPDDTERIRGESHDIVLSEHTDRFVTYRMRHKAGHYVWMESLTKPVVNDQNEVIYLVASSRDVTERMRFIQRLQILHRIDQAILRADTPKDIAQMTLTSLSNLLSCQRAFVVNITLESGDLIMLYDTNNADSSEKPVDSLSWLPQVDILKTGRTIFRENLEAATTLSPMEQSLLNIGLFAYICVPFIIQQQFTGCLCLSFTKTQKMSDELRAIAIEVANQIAIGIEQARLYIHIREQNALLEQRVTNRTKQLQQALERERELSDLRSRFTSMISHEFRTPLASIQSSTDILIHYTDRLDDTQRQNHLERIQTQIKRLTRLMEDMLTIGRTEGVAPHRELVNLFAISSEIISEMQQSHTIKLSTEGSQSNFRVDLNLFRQILTNLLSNAMKYSPQNSKIFIELICTEEQAILKVRDQGIGIPKKDQKHLFETFHRAGNVGDIIGTGLGLVIVKRAVEALEGTIDFISHEGQGTTFEVKLPR